MIKRVLIFILSSVVVFAELREIETEYFKIIYPAGLEDVMGDVAHIADDVAEKEFAYFQFEPEEKFLIIYRNNNDIDESRIDYKSIILHPNINKNFTYEKNYENWIEFYLANNLAKLIVNNKINGVFDYTWAMKNTLHAIFTPAWLVEGVGIYSETKFTNGGRGRSAKFDMFIKAKVLEGEFDGLSLTSIEDNLAKYYGYSFLKFYEESYGEEALKLALDYFSNHQVKGPTDGFLFYAGLEEFEDLEELWIDYLHEVYVKTEDITEGTSLTNKGGYKFYTKLYDKKIYYGIDVKGRSGIEYFNPNRVEVEKVSGINPISGFEIVDDTIYYSQVIPNVISNNNFAYSYKREIDKKLSKRLEVTNAINFVAINGSGAGVFRRGDRQSLEHIDGEVFIGPEYGFIFQKLVNQDNYIYFSATKVEDGGNYIYRYDIENKGIEKLIEGYSPFVDNNHIYYSNNIDGIYNIYRYDLETRENIQVTNVAYGGFEPVYSNRVLYYLEFGLNGFDLYSLEEEAFYNKVVEIGSYNKEVVVGKGRSDKVEGPELISSESDFNNSLRLKDLIITPEGLLLAFQDELLRHSILLGNTTFEKKGIDESQEGYFFKKDPEELEKGVFLLYMYSRDAFPMPLVILNSQQSREENLTQLKLNLPYFMKSTGIPIFSDFTINNDDYMRFSISLAGALGVAQNIDNEQPYTEIFLESPLISLNYYISSEPVSIEDQIGYFSLLTLPDFESGILKYNMKNTKRALRANSILDYGIEINKGTKTGRNTFRSVTLELDTAYLDWHNEESQKTHRLLIFKPSIQGEFKLNYNIDLTLATGYVAQFDLAKGEEADDGTAYFGFGLRF